MSKKITITLYSPKELWEKFWDRFFWPRRVKCAEWCEFGRYEIERVVISEVLDKADKVLDTDDMIQLELALKNKIEVFTPQKYTLSNTNREIYGKNKTR